jgi:hypothetical protein
MKKILMRTGSVGVAIDMLRTILEGQVLILVLDLVFVFGFDFGFSFGFSFGFEFDLS